MALQVSRILHAGYIFDYCGTAIAFDPIFENPFSRNCYAFPDVKFDQKAIQRHRLDAVVISHHHDDHCSLESLDLLDRRTPIYLYCVHEELFHLIRQLGFRTVTALQMHVPVSIGSLVVTPHLAVDEDVDCLFHVKAGDLNVLNVVDAWIHPLALEKLARLAPWDMILWPFQTLREIEVLAPTRALPPERGLLPEFAEQLAVLRPRVLVPSSCQFRHESWSWYNQAIFPISYAEFARDVQVQLPQVQVVRMDPSVSVSLTKHSLTAASSLTWIHLTCEQQVDYEFSSELTPPSTAEIAKNFLPLTTQQHQQVIQYCGSALLQQHSTIACAVDDYFCEPRIWCLKLFDHLGNAYVFQYRILGAEIEETRTVDGPMAWLTELPIAKLYAALESGETFTSMYFRINDCVFEPELERVVAQVDFSADPLVRCLFGGTIAGYQKYQLNKLRQRRARERTLC